MSLRSNQLHLIGAIGYLLSALLTMLSLVLVNSYYVSTAAISVFSMLSTCLVLIYFFCTATTSKDTMIKTGGFLAGSGYGVLLLMALFQMMGVAIPVISLIGAITAIAGVVLVAVKFMLLFQRDSIIVILCIVTFIGLFLCFFGLFIGSIVSGIGDIITGISLGSLLLYFRSHNIFC